MKDGKKFDNEIIHRLLDEDPGADEKRALTEQVDSDPVLKEEFEGIARAVRAVETSAKVGAPPFFTAQVMRKLPQRRVSLAAKIGAFMLKGRVLKWNMATALAASLLLAVVLTYAVRTRDTSVQTAAVSHDREQLVTVTMKLHAPEAHQVSVAGTFNKWKADANVLTRQENGIWTISIPLKPGEYNYMFIVDGKAWITDPNAESYSDDGFGNKNAVVRVKI